MQSLVYGRAKITKSLYFCSFKREVMKRCFIYLAYDGTSFHGWQRQPNAGSVQETLEEGLSRLLGRKTEVVGAGRTDAGVHASLMVAHFDLSDDKESRWCEPNLEELTYRLRCVLPHSIFIYTIVRVQPEAHARFDAQQRTYHYYVRTEDSPFALQYSFRPLFEVSFDRMNDAASCLKEHTDFTSFSKVNTDVKTFNCRISHAQWTRLSPTLWQFEISADRFLRNMVRAVVGTMLDIGRREGDARLLMNEVLERKSRSAAGESVPGNALFLSNILYPESIFIEGQAPHLIKKEAFLDF